MKKTVRILTLTLLALLLCVGLIACAHKEASDHTATGDWLSDDTNHWHACEKEKCEDAGDRAAHTYTNACDTTCDVCNYERTAGAHVYDNACDAACNVCGATRTITHDHATTLTKGDTTHWYACSVCGDKKDESAHAFTVEAANSDTLKAAATDTAKAQYWKSCVCGKVSTTEYFESDKTVATLTDIQDLSKDYDGTAVSAPTYLTNSTGVVTVEWYQGSTKLPAAPVNAGAYTVKVIVAETATHAGASATKAFAIAKATPTLTNVALSPVEIAYGNSYNVNYSLTSGAGTVTVEYKVKNAADSTYTTSAPTNVGVYTARVTVAESDNYLGTSVTVDFDIEACVLANLSTNVAYNGSSIHDIDLSVLGYHGVTLRVTFDSKNVGATATAVAVLENGEPTSNYTVNAATCDVDIVAKSVSVVWNAPASLRFDGTEKIPTATLNGVVTGDECTVQISKKDGDNVWFDVPFTFEAMMLEGADAGNYALPLNGDTCTSPEYTITIDTMTVGAPSYIADGVYYQKIVIETAGDYYFDFACATQGVEITFTIFEKGATYTTIPVFTVGDEDKQSAAFALEAGTYYVKSATDDEPQYDTLAIVADTHATADAYGFCDKGCGTYLGEALDTNCWESVTIPRGNTVYYRFEDGGDVNYNLSYFTGSDSTNLTVKCYRVVNAEGDFEELTGFGLLPHEFATSYDGYYYLTIKHNNALGGSAEKSITFQIEETNV